MNITNMSISRIISHEAIRHSELADRAPVLSSSIIRVDNQAAALVTERIINAVSSGSHCVDVIVDDDNSGSPFDYITKLFDCQDSQFVQITQSLALSLSHAQTSGSIKSGTVLFVNGTCNADGDNRRYMAIIKADSDRVLQKRILDEGSIVLTYIADTLLGESQKLFKIAFYLEEFRQVRNTESRIALRSTTDFEVKVFDHNLQNSSDSNAAMYFYGTFLKCRLADNAKKQTKNFFESSLRFISELDIPSEEKLDYKGSLMSYLRGNIATIEPGTFAREVFPIELQDAFVKSCTESEITAAFTKDNGLIKKKLKNQSVRFSSNVVLTAEPNVIRDSVRIGETNDDGWTEVMIKGLVEE